MTAQHAILQPSSAARWVACPGSVKLEALYPEDTESEKAREGTAAHWALAEVLNGRAVAEGQLTDDGFMLTREMCEAAESLLRHVQALCAEHGEQPNFRVEQRVVIPRVHAECWGTPDVALYFSNARRVYCLDFKYGHGFVEVFENWQLVAYLAGLLDLWQIDGLADQSTSVVGTIDQPRSFHRDGPRREWRVMASDLRPLINRLSHAAHEAMGEDPKLRVNPECDNCKARHACPQLQAEGLRGIDRSGSAVPFDLPAHAAGIELADLRRAIKALEARETGLSKQIESMLTAGERVPFWGIEHVPGKLAWNVSAAEVLALGMVSGQSLAKPPEPITPTQAKDRRLIDPVVLAAMASRSISKQLVMRDDDSARRIFG